ncbi:MAG: type III-B CRISPR module RAMP protein Cmr4 [Pyramidobacter sp.]|jgi:CRISPR-associated protein Cmr4
MNGKTEHRYWIHTVTPLHVGAGRGLGHIDLPIVREAVTNWPYIPGSSIKGVLADHFKAFASDEKRKKGSWERAAFGAPGDDVNGNNAGSLVFTDAHLLCLPVRSFYGTFAWVTSPFCLKRFDRDMGIDVSVKSFAEGTASVCGASKLTDNSKIYLEDLDLTPKTSDEATAIARKIASTLFADDEQWRNMFVERFVIVDDDIFSFLCENGTEVTPHVRISETTGIVANGALWYEEALPVETILTGKVWCDRVYGDLRADDLMAHFANKKLKLQVGGKASTGKGLVSCVFE